ncbi:MAG: hypothetical protein EBR09_08225 [Proteobacteria bacterium]|nr:hypothetical protein [Pseudomonadota bacterium]
MCGFSGLLTADHKHPRAAERTGRFDATAERISHRGSDDARMVKFNGVALNHFRLAFQDIESGRQPMISGDGQWAILFNGEIYNHHDLRAKIEKKYGRTAWRTTGDTETILEGWLLQGDSFADELEGEFAFVIVRTNGSSFFAARDHFGVKPLFFSFEDLNTRRFSSASDVYAFESPLVGFASEMKALPMPKVWNRDGVLRQFTGLFEPICTPFENIIQCPAGGRLSGTTTAGTDSAPVYNIRLTTKTEAIRQVNKGEFWSSGDLNDRLEKFRDTFSKSVSDRLLSDVELGVYLSGGIDSKAVAFELSRILEKQNPSWNKKSIKSFTVGFETEGYDESAEAVAYSRYLGFTPHVLKVSQDSLRYSYPHAVYISENIQPYTNGAAKWWLSLFARRSVSGVLTGDGADEVLCGYPSFRYCAWWAFSQRNRDANTPIGRRWRDTVYIKKFSAQTRDPWLAGSSAEGRGDDFAESLALWGVPHPLFGQIRTIAESILGPDEAGRWLASQAESVRSWFLHGTGKSSSAQHYCADPENALLLWQNYFCQTHLPVQVLNWVGDRMEMANTLEGRTPFLSGQLRTLIAALPDAALVQGFTDKAILRKAYASQLPRQFVMTPKKQFNAPFVDFSVLFREYDAAALLEKTGIRADGVTAAEKLLKETQMTLKPDAGAGERYVHTHRSSAMQTLICAAIVQRTLVEENPVKRNLDFENSVISKGGLHP